MMLKKFGLGLIGILAVVALYFKAMLERSKRKFAEYKEEQATKVIKDEHESQSNLDQRLVDEIKELNDAKKDSAKRDYLS